MTRLNIIRFFLVPVFCALLAPTANAYTNRPVAVIQVLNKAAGKTQTLKIPVGETSHLEKLNIPVRSCMQSDPFDAENFYAFVEIAQSGNTKFFGNWMDRNNPGKNPVQNPDYDAWLVKCE